MATAQVTNVMLAEVPVGLSGEASGLHTTVRQLGAVMGVALLGGLLISVLSHGAETRMVEAGVPEPIRGPVTTAVHESIGQAIPALWADPRTSEAADAAAQALVHAAKVSTGVAAGILGLGFLATLGLANVTEEERQRRRNETEDALTAPELTPRASEGGHPSH